MSPWLLKKRLTKLTVSEEMNMNDEEILKVVKALTGTITPIADSHYDEKAKKQFVFIGKCSRHSCLSNWFCSC